MVIVFIALPLQRYSFIRFMKKIIHEFFSLFFPNLCKVCLCKLIHSEQHICMGCFYHLPKINLHSKSRQQAEDRLLGKFEFEQACSFIKYVKGSRYHNLLLHLKYYGSKELGEFLGFCLGIELNTIHFFSTIDYIVPVPLHKNKLKKRGYNQSEWIAKGLAKASGKNLVTNNLYRINENTTQTTKHIFERWKNVENLFKLENPTLFDGKHVLLVDDVLTTGATLSACALAFSDCRENKISVATLSIA